MWKQVVLNVDHNIQRQVHLCRRLEALGLRMHRARSADKAKEMAKHNWYDLALIDVATLGKEQIDPFCSLVRTNNRSAILIMQMASVKPRVEERLFDMGVDDVVVGPQISARLLAKRIRVHLHRRPTYPSGDDVVRLDGSVVDFGRREVWRCGRCCPLPGILADLLKYFVDHPNRAISRKELEESPIWNDSICTPAEEGGKTLDVNVSKLRKIIERDPAEPRIILSVRGIGWKLRIDSVDEESVAPVPGQ